MSVASAGTLHHTCWVVRDIEASARALAQTLGVTWSLWTLEPRDATLHGKPARFSFRIAVASLGDSRFELISPAEGESTYTEHLRKHGEGFHHTCLAYPSLAAMRSARDALTATGRTMVQSGVLGSGGEFYYFELPEMHSILELLYLTELPPPELTIG